MNRARNVPLLTAIVATLLALGLCAVHLWVKPLPGLAAFEGFAIDARFRIRGPRPPASDRVVIVGLDDDTRRQFPETFQTRRGYAELFHALAKYDVKVIALDLFFNAPEVLLPGDLETKVREANQALAPIIASPMPAAPAPAPDDPTAPGGKAATEIVAAPSVEQSRWELAQIVHEIAEEMRGDEILAKAITDTKRVFLGAFFIRGRGKAREAEPAKLALARHGESADSGSGGLRRPVHAVAVNFTLDDIGSGAIGAGALNALRDDDGVTRSRSSSAIATTCPWAWPWRSMTSARPATRPTSPASGH